jgi:enoyl-CoA hydratase/carnithine racemase
MPDDPSIDVVVFEASDAIGIVRLNRPQVHNAVNEPVMEALEAILNRVETDPQIRALVVTGTGRTFCAGGDLQYFATLDTREKGLEMSRRMQALLGRLWSGSKPVIAEVNGQALGGGCEILTACHFRIAASTASFMYRQAENGLITGWGGGGRLFNLVGRTQALRLLLTGESIDSGEALRIGLIDRIVEPEELHKAVIELAASVSKHSAGVTAAILELARLNYGSERNKAVERETELFADRWVSDEFREAIDQFQRNRGIRKDKKGE